MRTPQVFINFIISITFHINVINIRLAGGKHAYINVFLLLGWQGGKQAYNNVFIIRLAGR